MFVGVAVPELTALELLVAVGRLGSLGAAAARVGMAQPNASRALARLERRMGMQLLVRSTRGSSLTEAGRAVAEAADHVLVAAAELDVTLEELRHEAHQRLRVMASQTVAEFALPRWLALLRRQRPEVRVMVTVGNSEAVLDAVRRDAADLGFIETSRVHAGVTSRVVGQDDLVLVVAQGHSWATRTAPIPLGEVAATPLVVREGGSGTRMVLEDVCARAGVVPAPPAQALSSNAAVRVAVQSGIAPAVLSEHVVAGAVAAGTLRIVPIADAVLRREFRAVWPAGPLLHPAGAALVALAASDGRARPGRDEATPG